jgi:hypothetical protein
MRPTGNTSQGDRWQRCEACSIGPYICRFNESVKTYFQCYRGVTLCRITLVDTATGAGLANLNGAQQGQAWL